jgi:two-component system, chemotaxis family, sensor kinase CheA
MNASDPAEIFRVEAQELLEQIEQGLLDLERSPADGETIARVFRALHTLKGSGAMFGFDRLAGNAHACETAFDRVRKGTATATPELIAAALAMFDHLRALANGHNPPAGRDAELAAGLHNTIGSAAQTPAANAPPPRAGWQVRFRLPPEAAVNGTRPFSLIDELRGLGECKVAAIADAVPPLAELDPRQCLIGWDVTLFTGQPRQAIEDVFIFLIDDMTLDIAPLEARQDAAAPEPPQEKPAEPAETAASQTGDTLRVAAGRLDDLMEQVGELVIAQSRLKQAVAHSADTNLRAAAEDIERLASGLRDSMMSVRMVPIGQLFGRFRRLVHDLSRETGKEIELATEGENTELDKSMIERLADPLIHLIRNAISHGLELPEERLAAGKPAAGRIVLSARQSGTDVIITVADDGRGIALDRVRAKAEEAGLLSPGTAPNDTELQQLIFQPGFSTAGKVTNLSGRGVGMDVVRSAIETLRGVIDLTSKPGQGVQFSMRIPLTLAILDGLLVSVDGAQYVIPLYAVEECFELSDVRDARSVGRGIVTLRGRIVPLLNLRERFGTGDTDACRMAVVVSTGIERTALAVDRILGDHQTVIKPMSRFHVGVRQFSGATILGDGSVALILDVAHLIAASGQQEQRRHAAG